MTRAWKTVLIVVGVLLTVGVAAGFGFATAGQDEDQLTGSRLERARSAALEAVGPGEVVDAEIADDDGAAFEVEVLLADGRQVEVLLDDAYAVIGSGSDDEGAGEDDED